MQIVCKLALKMSFPKKECVLISLYFIKNIVFSEKDVMRFILWRTNWNALKNGEYIWTMLKFQLLQSCQRYLMVQLYKLLGYWLMALIWTRNKGINQPEINHHAGMMIFLYSYNSSLLSLCACAQLSYFMFRLGVLIFHSSRGLFTIFQVGCT